MGNQVYILPYLRKGLINNITNGSTNVGKAKRAEVNVDLLLKCGLFKGFNSERFETNFFSCFKLIKKNKGEYLFKQGDKREFIYFLKKEY